MAGRSTRTHCRMKMWSRHLRGHIVGLSMCILPPRGHIVELSMCILPLRGHIDRIKMWPRHLRGHIVGLSMCIPPPRGHIDNKSRTYRWKHDSPMIRTKESVDTFTSFVNGLTLPYASVSGHSNRSISSSTKGAPLCTSIKVSGVIALMA